MQRTKEALRPAGERQAARIPGKLLGKWAGTRGYSREETVPALTSKSNRQQYQKGTVSRLLLQFVAGDHCADVAFARS